MKNRVRRSATAAIVGSLLVACGGSSATPDDASDSASESPLSAIFGGNESPAESRRKQIKQEELVAQCMKEQGWDYTPVDYAAQFDDGSADADANLSQEEYGKKYAYGVTHNYELYELPYLTGEGEPVVDEVSSGDGGEFSDPNGEYVNSLSESEQQQYYEDLSGAPIEVDEEIGSEDETFAPVPLESQGCYGVATKEVFGESPFNDPEVSARLDEIFQAMQDDPRLKDAEQKWVTCLREIDASYEIPSPNDTWSYMSKVKAELSGQEIVPLDPATGEPVGGAGDEMWSSAPTADGSGWAFLGEPKSIIGPALDDLRTQEFALWNADQDCQKQIGLIKLRKQVEEDLADQILQEFPQLDKSGGDG